MLKMTLECVCSLRLKSKTSMQL